MFDINYDKNKTIIGSDSQKLNHLQSSHNQGTSHMSHMSRMNFFFVSIWVMVLLCFGLCFHYKEVRCTDTDAEDSRVCYIDSSILNNHYMYTALLGVSLLVVG